MSIIAYNELEDSSFELELAKVDNGSGYPGAFSKFESKKIIENCGGSSLHLFSGSSLIGDVRVDFSHPNATINQDVFSYLENAPYFDTVVIDPPYNERFAKVYNQISGGDTKQFIVFANAKKTTILFNLIKAISPKTIIIKSWNYYVPKDYKIKECIVCYAGGYRKATFLMILEREDIE